jgi:hypothetical protein
MHQFKKHWHTACMHRDEVVREDFQACKHAGFVYMVHSF